MYNYPTHSVSTTFLAREGRREYHNRTSGVQLPYPQHLNAFSGLGREVYLITSRRKKAEKKKV